MLNLIQVPTRSTHSLTQLIISQKPIFNSSIATMTTNQDEVELDLSPLIRVYKDGKVERLLGTATVPAGTDSITGVKSKDVIISSEHEVGVRLYLPKHADSDEKRPVLVYYHGGGFCVCSAWLPEYHTYLNQLSNEANVIVVSVNYRLAPEHQLPAAFEDSWTALKWVASHSGSGSVNEPEPWLSEYVDFNKVFLAGDSAGGNIVHHMAMKVGEECVKLDGIVLFHPFFGGVELIGNEANIPVVLDYHEKIWKLVHPGMTNLDDPVINPLKDFDRLKKVGCERVLVCVALKDSLADRGLEYGEVMKRCGKDGLKVQVFKSEGMDHVFHLANPNAEESMKLMKKVVEFINA